jgi:hypothetical protein
VRVTHDLGKAKLCIVLPKTGLCLGSQRIVDGVCFGVCDLVLARGISRSPLRLVAIPVRVLGHDKETASAFAAVWHDDRSAAGGCGLWMCSPEAIRESRNTRGERKDWGGFCADSRGNPPRTHTTGRAAWLRPCCAPKPQEIGVPAAAGDTDLIGVDAHRGAGNVAG